MESNNNNPSAFEGKSLTFRRNNWKSFRVIYGLVICTAFATFLLCRHGFIEKNWPGMIPIPFFMFYIIGGFGLLTKITIDPNGITCKTIFQTKHYPWMNIQTVGMFIRYGNAKQMLPINRYQEKFFYKEKFIFISTQPVFVPQIFTVFNATYADFHYRENVFELIEHYLEPMKKKPSYIYPPGGNLGLSS
jgi:predicted permease